MTKRKLNGIPLIEEVSEKTRNLNCKPQKQENQEQVNNIVVRIFKMYLHNVIPK